MTTVREAFKRRAPVGSQLHQTGSEREADLSTEVLCWEVGVNQTCGVDGCFCGMLSDLLCDEPPLPAEICIKVELCCAESCRHVETHYSRPRFSARADRWSDRFAQLLAQTFEQAVCTDTCTTSLLPPSCCLLLGEVCSV